jgi:hypothetical protein
VNIGAVFAHCC